MGKTKIAQVALASFVVVALHASEAMAKRAFVELKNQNSGGSSQVVSSTSILQTVGSPGPVSTSNSSSTPLPVLSADAIVAGYLLDHFGDDTPSDALKQRCSSDFRLCLNFPLIGTLAFPIVPSILTSTMNEFLSKHQNEHNIRYAFYSGEGGIDSIIQQLDLSNPVLLLIEGEKIEKQFEVAKAGCLLFNISLQSTPCALPNLEYVLVFGYDDEKKEFRYKRTDGKVRDIGFDSLMQKWTQWSMSDGVRDALRANEIQPKTMIRALRAN